MRLLKNGVLTALLIVLSAPIGFTRQVHTDPAASRLYPNAELVRESQFSDLPSYIKFRKSNQIEIDELRGWMKTNFKFDPNIDFKLIRKEKDKLGHVHYRFQQTYYGNLVEDAIWIAHTNNDRVYSLNGLIFEKFVSPTTAALSEEAALESALSYVGATTYKWEIPAEEQHLKWEAQDQEATYFPKGELVFVSLEHSFTASMYRMAYKFNIYANEPMSRAEIYVDANTGEIIREHEIIHTIDEPGIAHTAYSGERDIIADSFGGEYRLHDMSRGDGVRTFDLNNATTYGGAVDFIDDDNDWDNVNPEQDEYATDAHWGAEMTYDYFFLEHGRNSIDNAGFQLNSYVHYGNDFFNAFWDGTRMTYGDGNGGSITPLTSIDIAGHEVAHGLTTFSAGLVYSMESGALNESFSDIFGTMIEHYARPDDNNWLIGEDIGTHFRSMSNPNSKGDPDTYFGDFWAPLGGGDYGGVHTNSGVQNFWFYLLCEGGTGTNDNGDDYDVTALGIEDASAIAFRNLTVYLISSSQFIDARFYAIESAVDLFGGCTTEVEETADAWYAVGVGDVYDPTTTANFSSLDTEGCFLPHEVIFSNDSYNAMTFEWDFGDGTTSTEESPVHIYTEEGTYTVTLSVDGGACGSDEITYVDFITINPEDDCIFTLPPDGELGTKTACTGTIFDSGGPGADYSAGNNSQVTIAPLGAATVDLNFISFDVEDFPDASCGWDWLELYDGEDEFAPLIDRYCNANLPPATVTSSGGAITIVFHSDSYVQEAGFEIEWSCNPPDDVPYTDFFANSEITCSGTVYFTDISTNIPIEWSWDFGDGETSTEQHPIHTYDAEGVYSVTLTATNLVGDSTLTKVEYVNVSFPEAPEVVGDTNCVDQTATLSAVGEGTLKWYTDPTGGAPIFEGGVYETPALDATTTYYVEDDLYDDPTYLGPADYDFGTGDFYSGDQYLVFNNPAPVYLRSVDVNAGEEGERTIELRDNDGTVLESLTTNLPAGVSTVVLDFMVPVGTSLQLGTTDGSLSDLYRNETGATYPYTIDESVEIVGSSTGDEFYYYFYNWEVHPYNCASERVPVVAEVTFDSDIYIDTVDYICIEGTAVDFTATEDGGVWSADCDDCMDETGTFDPTISGTGTYEVTYSVDGTCSHFNTIMVDVLESDIMIDAIEDLCKDAESVVLTASEPGGIWSADCGGCVDEVTGEFDPTAAGLGTWTITYTVEGTCSEYNPGTVTVVESDITINPIDDICEKSGVVILSASEDGGTWSADCDDCIDPVTGEFDPSAAGIGEWTITYTVDGTCSEYNPGTVNVIDCLGLDENDGALSIFPNPTRGIITLNTGDVEAGTVIIKDVLGRVIFVQNFNQNQFSVDLNNGQADGTYFVTLLNENGDQITVAKVIKQ